MQLIIKHLIFDDICNWNIMLELHHLQTSSAVNGSLLDQLKSLSWGQNQKQFLKRYVCLRRLRHLDYPWENVEWIPWKRRTVSKGLKPIECEHARRKWQVHLFEGVSFPAKESDRWVWLCQVFNWRLAPHLHDWHKEDRRCRLPESFTMILLASVKH